MNAHTPHFLQSSQSAEPVSWGEGEDASKLLPSENIQDVLLQQINSNYSQVATHLRQPCQKFPSPGRPTRHTAKEVPLTLTTRFSCSSIPQTSRLLHHPPGKRKGFTALLVGCQGEENAKHIAIYTTAINFLPMAFLVELKYSWKYKFPRTWRFQCFAKIKLKD